MAQIPMQLPTPLDGYREPDPMPAPTSENWDFSMQLAPNRILHCARIWDPVNARFEPCVLPIIAAIPAVLGGCLLLGYILNQLSGGKLRPQWSREIVPEPLEKSNDGKAAARSSFRRPAFALLGVSLLGFLLQLSTVFFPARDLSLLFPTAAWAAAALIAVARRPRSTPYDLLLIFSTLFTSQVIAQINGFEKIQRDDWPAAVTMLLAFNALIIILCMPMRDPELPNDHISAVYSAPTNELRSPEDNLTLAQILSVSWMAPLLSLANKRELQEEDTWRLPYNYQHTPLHERFADMKGSLLRKLLRLTTVDIVAMVILSLLDVVLTFAAPILLQQFLRAMENPLAPRSAAYTYAILQYLANALESQADVLNTRVGRRAYERTRGAMITMLYQKALSRKAVSISTKPQVETNGNGKAEEAKKSLLVRIFSHVVRPFRRNQVKAAKKKEEMATTGKILNLIRSDAYEVSQRFWEASGMYLAPLKLVLSVVLIWQLIGWPCLVGVVTVVIGQGINVLIAKGMLHFERERRVASDTKTHKISQLVESLRHLRWYGWQEVWLERVMEARKDELWLKVVVALWRMGMNFVGSLGGGMFPVVAFYAYTVWAGQPLRLDIAFPALQLFDELQTSLWSIPELITRLLNSRVALQRIEAFMGEPDKPEAEIATEGNLQLRTENASFAWPGATEAVLHNIKLAFPPGISVVFGQVGCGKTALLEALLGELDLLNGEYHRNNLIVGYCAQNPWLQSMSIRDNILFSSPYNEARYREVLDACALIPDMNNFKNGDLSLIGENGIGLSGGQRARVALARAVYSDAKTLFLDDPLSALDHQTAESIVQKCFAGPLFKDRTVVLVTHRLDLCFGLAQQIIKVEEGKASILEQEEIDSMTSQFLHKVKAAEASSEAKKDEDEDVLAVPDKFLDDEHREKGDVKLGVYWEYIKAGKLRWWCVLVVVVFSTRFISIANTWFLKSWGEAYNRPMTSGLIHDPLADLPNPQANIRPWLVGFALIALAQSLSQPIVAGVLRVIIYNAGKTMFAEVMSRVVHATFRYYDVTPVGRIMNRLTSDVNTIDGPINMMFQLFIGEVISWISSLAVIGSITPTFLAFAIALTVAYVIIYRHFLPTSQSLRRLEMVSLTPLFSNVGALSEGLGTVRAFCAQSRFRGRLIAVVDDFQKNDHFYWSLQAWLSFRMNQLADLSTFLVTCLALYTGVSAGLTAFLLTSARRFVWATNRLCRIYGELQMDFVSVERVVELLHLEQEPKGAIEPPAYWPRLGGDIVFENVSIRYAPHLPPSLIDITLTIAGGSSTALIGRTGSGKSTLALSLLATTLPHQGRILIDGLDIATISTQALRSRITFLAQEPVLFPGSMRSNLDPLSSYDDTALLRVLDKISSPSFGWTLDTHVDTGGKNLSQGQRQLVGLARALLRRSAVVVMDEATASIDAATAGRIQALLREELSGSTVVTIAHRVEAVRGAEWCVVLAGGKVERVGRAEEVGGLMRG